MAKALPVEKQSEDCLHLNIFVPIEQGRQQADSMKMYYRPRALTILVQEVSLSRFDFRVRNLAKFGMGTIIAKRLGSCRDGTGEYENNEGWPN